MVKYIKYVIVTLLIAILVVFLTYRNTTKNSNELNLYNTTTLNDNEDPTVRDIYNQFNPEHDILFHTIGSGKENDLYAIYYQKDKVDNLDDKTKLYITLNTMEYKNFPKEDECYKIPIEDIKATYQKLFFDSSLDIDTTCIKDFDTSNYDILLDTYFDSYKYSKDNKILTIYDYIAFIKYNENNIEFYQDINMTNKIYTLDIDKTDISFINSVNTVSNVLIKYKDKFNKYKYVFEMKDNEHYSFSYIEKEVK